MEKNKNKDGLIAHIRKSGSVAHWSPPKMTEEKWLKLMEEMSIEKAAKPLFFPIGADAHTYFDAVMRDDKEKIREMDEMFERRRMENKARIYKQKRDTMSDDEFLVFCEIYNTYYRYTMYEETNWQAFRKYLNDYTDLIIDVKFQPDYTYKITIYQSHEGYYDEEIQTFSCHSDWVIYHIQQVIDTYKDFEL